MDGGPDPGGSAPPVPGARPVTGAGRFLADIPRRVLDRHTGVLAATYVALDAIALALYGLWLKGLLSSRFFRFGIDRSYIEWVEYSKILLIIWMLREAGRRTTDPVFRAWQLLFLVMLLDDILGLHESLGEALAHWWLLPGFGPVSPAELGEVVAFFLSEGVVSIWVGIHYLRSGPQARKFSRYLVLVIGLFAFCAIVVDISGHKILEECGEALAMTGILAYVHFHHRAGAGASERPG